jgi:hypothetical protein
VIWIAVTVGYIVSAAAFYGWLAKTAPLVEEESAKAPGRPLLLVEEGGLARSENERRAA